MDQAIPFLTKMCLARSFKARALPSTSKIVLNTSLMPPGKN